jgi:hypothetical protein
VRHAEGFSEYVCVHYGEKIVVFTGIQSEYVPTARGTRPRETEDKNMKNALNQELPGTTYELTFYDREGEVDSIQEHTNESDARETMDLFREPDSAELYSRITLTAYDWTTGTETTLKTLVF